MEYNTPYFPLDDCGDNDCDAQNYIVGPPGAAGPIGPQGPIGPIGPIGSAGLQAVVEETTIIPIGQLYTIVNAPGVTTQTLPAISLVLVNGVGTPYTVYNFSGFQIGILPTGLDLIQGSSEAFEKFQNESVTFLPTSLGWLVI